MGFVDSIRKFLSIEEEKPFSVFDNVLASDITVNTGGLRILRCKDGSIKLMHHIVVDTFEFGQISAMAEARLGDCLAYSVLYEQIGRDTNDVFTHNNTWDFNGIFEEDGNIYLKLVCHMNMEEGKCERNKPLVLKRDRYIDEEDIVPICVEYRINTVFNNEMYNRKQLNISTYRQVYLVTKQNTSIVYLDKNLFMFYGQNYKPYRVALVYSGERVVLTNPETNLKEIYCNCKYIYYGMSYGKKFGVIFNGIGYKVEVENIEKMAEGSCLLNLRGSRLVETEVGTATKSEVFTRVPIISDNKSHVKMLDVDDLITSSEERITSIAIPEKELIELGLLNEGGEIIGNKRD